MRKSNREVTDREEILEIMKNCTECTLALNDEGYPYLIPLNFGLEYEGDEIRLIFHSAMEGYKLDLIRRDNRASFEMDCKHQLQYFEEKGYCTYAYESVCGRGRIEFLPEEEKAEALDKVMDHYHPGMHAWYNPETVKRTCVYVLHVESLTGKRKLPK